MSGRVDGLVLRAQRVAKAFGRPPARRKILDGVTFSLRAGDSLALSGPSGAGKTTLLSILGALDPDFQGEVEVAGQALRGLGDPQASRLRRERLGFAFQGAHLLGHLSALDNVLVPAHFAGRAPDRARARHLLARVGLAGRLAAHPRALSGGERQRVALARALVMRPALVLADEPTGNLDPHAAEAALALLAEAAGEGTAWIVVTHDPAVAARARRQMRLVDGTLTRLGARG